MHAEQYNGVQFSTIVDLEHGSNPRVLARPTALKSDAIPVTWNVDKEYCKFFLLHVNFPPVNRVVYTALAKNTAAVG